MKNKINYIAVIIVTLSVLACGSEDSKPISKIANYPTSLYGTWEWPCVEDYDTQGTASPLYRRQKRTYGENSSFMFERTTYKDSNCISQPMAKGIHKGTFNIVSFLETEDVKPVPYVEINYVLTDVIFEGNKPIAATTASTSWYVDGYKFYGIAKVFPELAQLHIGWNGDFEDNVQLRPGDFKNKEVLRKSSIRQPAYPAAREYDTKSISDVAGQWAETCRYKGEFEGVSYYRAWKYDISVQVAQNTYIETLGLYDNDLCTGSPVSLYTYPGTIKIDTSVYSNGIGPTNLVGVSGLHTIITSTGARIDSVTPTGNVSLNPKNTREIFYDVMISDPQSEYMFVYGLRSQSPVNEIIDIYVRQLLSNSG